MPVLEKSKIETLLDGLPWELKPVKLLTSTGGSVEIMALCYNGFAYHDVNILPHKNEGAAKFWGVTHIKTGLRCSPDKPDMKFKLEDQACLFLYKISQVLDFEFGHTAGELESIWDANKSNILESYYSTLEEIPVPKESEV